MVISVFSAPNDAKEHGEYMLVFRGQYGNEEDAVIGKIVHGVPSTYLCIWGYIAENQMNYPPCSDDPSLSSCQEHVIVWDLRFNAVANDILDNDGNPVTFPIQRTEISDWIDDQIAFTGDEALFDYDIRITPHLFPGLSGAYDEYYEYNGLFGLEYVNLIESWSGEGCLEPDCAPLMWCWGDGKEIYETQQRTGSWWTAQNGSDERFISSKITNYKRTLHQWGEWQEGKSGTGGTSISEEKKISVSIPLFDITQNSSNAQRQGECNQPVLGLGCVVYCGPVGFENDIEVEKTPSFNDVYISGAFFDTDNVRDKWIFVVASMEDNESRTGPDTNFANGDRYAYAAIEKGCDTSKAPSTVAKNSELTTLLQSILDQTVAEAFQYKVYK